MHPVLSKLNPVGHWLAFAALLAGCSAEPSGVQNSPGGSGGSATASAGSGATLSSSGAAGGGASGRARCQAPPGVSSSPHTIEDAVALINALPKPTNAACFVESLDRPLYAFATSSTISLQPALSYRSPRVFLRVNDRLVLSIVIDGDSSNLIEFGYLLDDSARSIKGEIKVPLLGPIPSSMPYDRVRYSEGTVCGVCHGPDERVDGIGFASAFSSVAFRPNVAYQVPLAELAHEREICDPNAEPHRCEMLGALFDGGPVSDAEFPETMTLFF